MLSRLLRDPGAHGGGGGGARGPSVFVGNIPWAATEHELRDLFAGCGQVRQFRILVDRETNRSRGKFAFVGFQGICLHEITKSKTSLSTALSFLILDLIA